MDRRELLKSLAAAPLLAAAAHTAALPVSVAGAGRSDSPLRARRLQQGMTVGLVSPASNVEEDQEIAFATEVVRSLGFEVKQADHLFQRNQYLAGTDQQRAQDLNKMFSDADVDAIFCLRGGYGSSRLLPLLDYDGIAANPKVLLGYSDITALLNAIYTRTGLITFHGPIAAANFTDYSYAAFSQTLMEARVGQILAAPPPFEAAPGRAERHNRLTRIHAGSAQGPLLGGNLTLLCHLLGTPFEPDFEGCILFLEDVEESPLRIDRMLTQLWLAGVLDRAAGIAFGKFTDGYIDSNSFSVERVLTDRCSDLGIPVLKGLMIGHIDDQAVIPVGARARLDADAGTLTLIEPGLV